LIHPIRVQLAPPVSRIDLAVIVKTKQSIITSMHFQIFWHKFGAVESQSTLWPRKNSAT
jgi:hypothetical protein